jgi:hypothetical protein
MEEDDALALAKRKLPADGADPARALDLRRARG